MHPLSGKRCVLGTVPDPEEGDTLFLGCQHTKPAGAAGKCWLLSLEAQLQVCAQDFLPASAGLGFATSSQISAGRVAELYRVSFQGSFPFVPRKMKTCCNLLGP